MGRAGRFMRVPGASYERYSSFLFCAATGSSRKENGRRLLSTIEKAEKQWLSAVGFLAHT